MKKSIVLVLVTIIMMAAMPAMAYAIQASTYDSYGNWKQGHTFFLSFEAASKWLWDTRSVDYKGIVGYTPSGVKQTRLRQQQFDNRNTGNWLGYGYQNKSALVYECQRSLAYLGYNPWSNLDGLWGPTTENAVRRFQSNNGLSSDGVVGGITWGVLSANGDASWE